MQLIINEKAAAVLIETSSCCKSEYADKVREIELLAAIDDTFPAYLRY